MYYVYYDENYPTHWVSERSAKKIVEFFTSKYDFEEIDARELAEVMSKSLDIHDEVIIVFSQDVIPNTVVDNPERPSEDSLIKRFLLRGHTIIWIGDIPLFWIGIPNREKKQLGRTGYNLFYPNLPRDFELPNSPLVKSDAVDITPHGALLGLVHRWDSWRPIPENWTITGRPKLYTLANYYTGTVYRPVSYIIDYGGYGSRGLVRLYDCKLPDISKEMLEQLARVTFYRGSIGIERMLNSIYEELRRLREDLEVRFKAVKGDMNNIGQYIKEALEILRTRHQNSNSK